ncbi:MAG: AAA family ATPase [Okeania sp. SIO2C9]|uniref:AAA family ATPase n=1 Tax=Okeania sp. SIO2C9 TaxID=2607791 RepID=UPI0013C08EE8|nr:AAA family ATPase [Okeania sp. SIO2C9]NEQ73548.1 AAA family ATPase [Okeania sp. SIO2C9]
MRNFEQWDKFLITIAKEADLKGEDREFFLKRFDIKNENLTEEKFREQFLSNYSKDTLGYYRKAVFRQLKIICKDIDHDRKGKYKEIFNWLKREYETWYTRKENPDILTEFPQKVSTVNNFDVLPESQQQVSNPFIPLTGIIDNPKLFFNREREINRIFEVLNSGSSIAIIGNSGVGKSSLLKAIAQKATQYLRQPRRPIYIDLQHIHSDDDFYAALCDEVGIEKCSGYKLNRNIKKYRILLLLDVVENMSYDWFTNQLRSQLRALANDIVPPLRLVVAASKRLDILFPDSGDKTSPFKNICIEEYLEPWNEETIRAFIESRLQADFLEQEYQEIKFSEDEILEIIKTSGGYPIEVMRLCYEKFEKKKL